MILSIIGLGWQTFVVGVFKGGEKIINSNPEIKNITQKVKQYIIDIIKNASEEVTENSTVSNQSSSDMIQSEEEEGNKEKLHLIELVIYSNDTIIEGSSSLLYSPFPIHLTLRSNSHHSSDCL